MNLLIIQCPCYNEEQTLGETLSDLPKTLPGVKRVELMIIDDGSSDGTVQIARQFGVHHIVSHTHNKGLAAAFVTGLKAALEAGADIIVNTDADNQYAAKDIARLIEPILAHRADMVVGARPIDEISHFSPIKKLLQKLGSWVVRKLSGTNIPDAPSGFRAISRDAAKRLFVYSRYTYTLETIIQCGHQGMRVLSVPVAVNGETRPSRLIKGTMDYVFRSLITILRTYVIYRPLRIFSAIAAVLFILGAVLVGRFFYFFVIGLGNGFIQSLVIGAGFLVVSVLLGIAGVLADLIAVNRRLLEEVKLLSMDIKERIR